MRSLFAVLLLVLVACDRGADRAADRATDHAADSAAAADQPTFDPSLEINPAAMTKTPSGLLIQDVVVGEGADAAAGREVTVHYTGWLPNGQKFDSSRDRAEPFIFKLGVGQVIRGWDEGVAGMKVGGRRKLVIPPDLAYGEAGAPPDIPPGATLVFDVELLGVK